MKKTGYFKEFAKYSSLNVLGMTGLSCYILADTFFISKGLGADGLTALNLAIPVYSFINGSGLMIGMGGGTKYSILKSRNDGKEANRAFSNAVCLALGISVIFLVAGLFFSGPLIKTLGADESVFQMSKTYLQVILIFAPVFMMNNVLVCFVRNDGSPQLAMAAMIGGSLSNVVLDYVFIFPLGMGIFGAVLATGLAPVISMLILSVFFIRKKNNFRFIRTRLERSLVKSIFSAGMPSLITEVSSGIVIIVFNSIMLRLLGNTGVAAYGIIANLSLVVIAVYTGIAQGIQPIISRNYGAGNVAGVQSTLRYAMFSMLAISVIVYCCMFFGGAGIAGIFNSEGNTLLQAIAENGLKLYFLACPFVGFNIIMSVYFTSVEYARPAHIISVLRGFIVIIPMAFLLSSLAGIDGVWYSFPVTELLVAVTGAVLYSSFRSRGRIAGAPGLSRRACGNVNP